MEQFKDVMGMALNGAWPIDQGTGVKLLFCPKAKAETADGCFTVHIPSQKLIEIKTAEIIQDVNGPVPCRTSPHCNCGKNPLDPPYQVTC